MKNKYYIYIDITYMSGFLDATYNHKYGGNDDSMMDTVYEMDNVNINAEEFFAGGAKAANERSFTVVKASVGSFEGGRFISTSAYNAAKKAATAVFRHVDIESGVTNPRKQASTTKNVKEIVVDKSLAAKFKRNPMSEVEIVLYRTDRQNAHKYYSYIAVREKIDNPQVIERVNQDGKTAKVVFQYKINIKPTELDEEYTEKNVQLSKEFNAAKRALKRRDANEGKAPKAAKAPKEAKAAKAAKKITVDDIIKSLTVKPTKAAKAAKPAKPAKAAKAAKLVTVDDIIKSLSAKPVAKAPKAPKGVKKPKAAPKGEKNGKAPRKALYGGNSCSFF